MYDVAIIGCGISGASVAFELSRYELSVVALERENDVATGTTKANSGIVHAGYDPEPGTVIARLNVLGNRLMGELCQALDVPFRRCGSLVLAFNEGEADTLEELRRRGEDFGVPGLVVVDHQRLRELEPNVSREAVAALYAPTGGIVCPWSLNLALMETAVRNGVELRLDCEVEGVVKAAGGYRVLTSGGELTARYVVNAAGVHADQVHNMVAKPTFRVIPDRGEYYLLDKSEGNFVNHVVFQCPTKIGKGALVAPTVHGNLIVGPSNEIIDSADDTATTAQGLAKVAEKVRRSVPLLNLRASIRNFAGVRAATDRDDFVVAEADDSPGWVDAAGIKSPGLTAAPATAKMVVGLLKEAGLPLNAKLKFIYERRPARFIALSAAEKTALIQKKPAYGRVICRCETVTEGELLAAMRGLIPPRSVDGVKRRVNAGMGRCQGGFCGPRVMELLAREMGVSPLDIPQDLKGSCLLVGETKGGVRHA